MHYHERQIYQNTVPFSPPTTLQSPCVNQTLALSVPFYPVHTFQITATEETDSIYQFLFVYQNDEIIHVGGAVVHTITPYTAYQKY